MPRLFMAHWPWRPWEDSLRSFWVGEIRAELRANSEISPTGGPKREERRPEGKQQQGSLLTGNDPSTAQDPSALAAGEHFFAAAGVAVARPNAQNVLRDPFAAFRAQTPQQQTRDRPTEQEELVLLPASQVHSAREPGAIASGERFFARNRPDLISPKPDRAQTMLSGLTAEELTAIGTRFGRDWDARGITPVVLGTLRRELQHTLFKGEELSTRRPITQLRPPTAMELEKPEGQAMARRYAEWMENTYEPWLREVRANDSKVSAIQWLLTFLE